jgi:hypothetical protein
MSLVIDLPADVEARLEQEARQKGQTQEEIVLRLIEEAFRPKTGAELLEWLQRNNALGAFKDRPDDWAQQLRHESNTRGRGNP